MIAVIGDIHGCYYTLTELVKVIESRFPGIKIYSVGDLVDRGKYSFEVVEFIKNEKIEFTPGNHDYMFLYFIEEPSSILGNAWIYNGSESTTISYEKRAEKIPDHMEFIQNSCLFLNLDDCFISHAGISTYYKSKLGKNYLDNLDKLQKVVNNNISSEHGILWTRDELVNLGKLQVVGHTRMNDVTLDEKSNAIYIDTSVYTGNKLSAVIVDQNKVVEILSVPTIKKDIN
ncbi:MAG: metallophosphoesterase [Ignavibacteriaceae bacterium]